MKHKSLAEMFLAQAERYGDRPLYRFHSGGKWRTMSWREARARVRALALGLAARGVGKGDRVALFLPNRVEWCLVDWANICLGALTVPVYASSTPAQAGNILAHCGAAVLFVDSTEKIKRLGEAISGVRLVVTLDGEVGADASAPPIVHLAELERAGLEQGVSNAFEKTASALGPDDDLTIIYTSGTTGEPKGVLTTHRHYL
ncbi:MAG TPA: AMP-binding protein, partial [Candidatus Binatia bacterium]